MQSSHSCDVGVAVWLPQRLTKQCVDFLLHDEAERRIIATLRDTSNMPVADVERHHKLIPFAINREDKSAGRASDLRHETFPSPSPALSTWHSVVRKRKTFPQKTGRED